MKWEQFRGLGTIHPVQTTPVIDTAFLVQALKAQNAEKLPRLSAFRDTFVAFIQLLVRT